MKLVQSGDVVRIKDFQTLGNVEGDILNVYYFETVVTGGPVPLASLGDDLINWWYNEFLTPVLNLQTSSLIHARMEIDNMMDFETDFAVAIPEDTVTGNVISEYSASSVAWSFQFFRQFRTTRHGSKRIAGVPESYMGNNLPAALVNTLAATYVDGVINPPQLTATVGGIVIGFIPVIAKTPTPPATVPTVFNNITGGVFRGIGSQNSRKQLLS